MRAVPAPQRRRYGLGEGGGECSRWCVFPALCVFFLKRLGPSHRELARFVATSLLKIPIRTPGIGDGASLTDVAHGMSTGSRCAQSFLSAPRRRHSRSNKSSSVGESWGGAAYIKEIKGFCFFGAFTFVRKEERAFMIGLQKKRPVFVHTRHAPKTSFSPSFSHHP